MMLSFEEVVMNEMSGHPAERLKRLVLRGAVAAVARPGQFLHVRVSSRLEPLLRRPLSIAAIDRSRGEVTLLYRVQGRGTEALAGVRPGERLNVLGPLGNGFTLPEQGELWLVGGGIGSFPLYALARAGLEQGLKVRLFWGGETGQFLESAGLAAWAKLNIPLHLSTLDGSLGEKGLVTEALLSYLDKEGLGNALGVPYESGNAPVLARGSGDAAPAGGGAGAAAKRPPEEVWVAACGPRGMMQAVAELGIALRLPVEVSLEERMGCGVGACLGCSVATRDNRGRVKNQKVCQDGPVFRGEEVVWSGGR